MDWSHMSRELLDLILSKLFAIDRNNFSLVCWPWNKIASPYYSPCLMLPNAGAHIWKVFQHSSFFSMGFSNVDQNAIIRCSKHGWLLMSPDDETLFFFNPFNSEKIVLPTPPKAFTTISFFHPPTSPDCYVIGISTAIFCPMHIGVLKRGESKWKTEYIYLPNHIQFTPSLAQPILHDGKIYFLDARGNVATVDVAALDMNDGDEIKRSYGYVYTKCLKQRRQRRNINEHFLVKSKGDGAIFAVFVKHAEMKVKVFRLVERFFWKPILDLEDRVFYVSNTSSIGYRTHNKSMANKVFFSKFHGDKVVFYSLDTRKYHSFGGDYSSKASRLKSFDLATWMMPVSTPQLPTEPLTWCEEDHAII